MEDRILLVEDEATLRDNVARYLNEQGHEVAACENGSEAMAQLDQSSFDVIITDLKLPGENGMSILERAREVSPGTAVLVMTAFGSVTSAVEAFRCGAYDYLLKPFPLSDLGQKLENINRFQKLFRENALLREEIQKGHASGRFMVGRSEIIKNVTELAIKVAPTPSTVLVTGETGTGKELVARAVHEYSGRQGLFVSLNLSAVPEGLVESHLFGHVRGAFTGADRAREGAFKAAEGGTLFLDEIGELPMQTQAKLLRTLEENEILPVGSDKPLRTDTRVIAATHRNLLGMIGEGTFREDLYFRLNVINIHIPPLRERAEDVPLLVEHFLRHYREELAKPIFSVSKEVMQCMVAYPWKGNVRELANVVERAVVLCEGDVITTSDLPKELCEAAGISESCGPLTLAEAVDHFKYRHILAVLEAVMGNRDNAAEVLGLSPSTLYRHMERLGLKGYRYKNES